MFVSLIEHTVEPGGDAYEAVPCFSPLSTLIVTRRLVLVCSTVMMLPLIDTFPVPVYEFPPTELVIAGQGTPLAAETCPVMGFD
jgi:hypothetical protein